MIQDATDRLRRRDSHDAFYPERRSGRRYDPHPQSAFLVACERIGYLAGWAVIAFAVLYVGGHIMFAALRFLAQ